MVIQSYIQLQLSPILKRPLLIQGVGYVKTQGQSADVCVYWTGQFKKQRSIHIRFKISTQTQFRCQFIFRFIVLSHKHNLIK
jgi:hypothetical protein